MKLKNVLLTGLSFVLVAAIAVGGTFAYLTSTDSDVNVMTLGNVSIEQHEYERVVNADGKWVSTGEIDKYGYTPDKLQEYTQAKPLLPAVFADGFIKWDDRNGSENPSGTGSHQQSWGQVGAPGSKQLFDDSVKNVQDKFVFVENTGKNDAYVRTWIAFEQGAIATDDFKNVIMTNHNENHWEWTGGTGDVVIDGNKYVVICATYKGPMSNPSGILAPNTVSYPSLLQVYMTPAATNEDVEAIDGNKNGTYDILVLSQAVQTDGFADAKTALDTAFGTDHPWTTDAPTFNAPADDAELEKALKNENAKQIIVNLTGDVTYDVDAWANDAMGGENTEFIMINGNGHTITFNQTNSDWNNIVTNGAKLIINNAKITNAGHNDGPWNRHDLNFACEVELNNVVSDKALAFKAGATLNNVTINDANTSDTYAIWIQPNGQTVTLNGCTIDMLNCTDGRGIKIDEQYVSNPAKVTLNVSNTTFKTEEKSAILVKSDAGADINLNNVDIYGVVADPINHVWVDEASEAYADLVIVNGGKKIVEGAVDTTVVSTKSELQNALKNAAANGEKNVVINANGQTIDMSYGLSSSTVPAGTTVTICNANVGASSYGNGVAGTVIFENCTFENPNGAYSIHFDSGSGHVIFNNCTLAGWCSFGSAIKSVEMNDCTILGNGIYAMVRFYQDTVMNNCTIDCSNTRTDDVYVDGLSAVNNNTLTLKNCELIYSDLEAADGGKIIADGNILVNAASDYTLVKNADR